MKKILILVATVMIFAFPALAEEHHILPFGMTIDIPDTYTVYRHDTVPPGDNRSAEEINAILDENNYVLMAIDSESKRGFIVFKAFDYPDENMNLKTATSEEREEFISFQKSSLGKKFNSYEGMITTPDIEFHKFRCIDDIDFFEYTTAVCGYEICVAMTGVNEVMSEEEIAEGDRIVKSIRFDDTLEKTRNEINAEIEAEKAETAIVRRKDFISFLVLLAILLLLIWLIARFVSGKKRKNKEQDAIRSASVTRTCRACGEPISESSEICPSCGTRQ